MWRKAFTVVKIIDGHQNVASHANNAVFDIIKREFDQTADATLVETSIGTLAIVAFSPRRGGSEQQELQPARQESGFTHA